MMFHNPFALSVSKGRLRTMQHLALFAGLAFATAACTGALPPGWGGTQVMPGPAKGLVFAAPTGKLFRLDPERRVENPAALSTGEWQFPQGTAAAFYFAPPAISNGTVYAATGDGRVQAVDGSTGQLLWEFPRPRTQPAGLLDRIQSFTGGSSQGVPGGLGLVMGAPAVSGDLVYVGGSNRKLYALDAKTGAAKWQFESGDKIWSSPAVSNGTVYFGSLDHHIYAVDAATGVRRWAIKTGGAVASSPLIVKDTLYIGAADKILYALDPATGATRWTFTADNWFWTQPAMGDGILYAGALDHRVYALDPASGQQVWPRPFEVREAIVAAPVVVGDTVVIATGDGSVFGLDARRGGERWTYALPNQTPIYSHLTTDGSAVYVTALDNTVYAIDPRTGGKLWEFKGG